MELGKIVITIDLDAHPSKRVSLEADAKMQRFINAQEIAALANPVSWELYTQEVRRRSEQKIIIPDQKLVRQCNG